jgi:hypothetical protein
MSKHDLTNQKFGRLIAMNEHGKSVSNRVTWLCQCDCGREKIVESKKLVSGHTKSCGCLNTERITKHGMSRTKIYNVWHDMINRTTNPLYKRWKDYGGRGITVCEQWRKFENFYADMGGIPQDMTLERINNDEGYNPNNCKWASYHEQFQNRRTTKIIEFSGEKLSLTEWAKKTGISLSTLRGRLKLGWSIESCFSTSVNKKNTKKEKQSGQF